MAELSTIARPYAEALYAAAKSGGQAAAWLAPLTALAQVADHPQVAEVLADPKLAKAQAVDLLAALSKQSLPDGMRNFVALIVDNDRVAALPQVAAQFRALKNADEGVADCLVETAFPLSDDQLKSLLASLARKFPLQLKPEVRVDPQLIGGVRVTVGDQVLDTSVRARLDQMRNALTA